MFNIRNCSEFVLLERHSGAWIQPLTCKFASKQAPCISNLKCQSIGLFHKDRKTDMAVESIVERARYRKVEFTSALIRNGNDQGIQRLVPPINVGLFRHPSPRKLQHLQFTADILAHS